MIPLFIFFYGLVFGSFFNVIGLRVPKGQSIMQPRSTCPACSHELGMTELVPVLSYVLQAGKCRACQSAISRIYPVMELITALLFLHAYFCFGLTADFVLALALISMLMIIVVSDLAYMIIPDKVLLFFFSLFLIGRIIYPLDPWWDSIVGGAAGFIVFFLIAVVSKGGMGGGDIKLLAVIGFLAGAEKTLVVFCLSCIFGALGGMVLMMGGVIKRGEPMPFGPFLALAALVAFFYGEAFLAWYLRFFS
ncbi:prepilin peptidase [Pseudobacillus badius]|uniref:prepilin peptidase n=1 Tax=Bacillus badius TaxID=1455 RepID=UPI0024A59FB4|nr:type 4 prepilin-like proteins leader peptide-processing enzyme [Bacillus badius]